MLNEAKRSRVKRRFKVKDLITRRLLVTLSKSITLEVVVAVLTALSKRITNRSRANIR